MGMKALKKLLNINLSSAQLEKLYEVIDADHDGYISMAGGGGLLFLHRNHGIHQISPDFMDAFQVVDIEQERRVAETVGEKRETGARWSLPGVLLKGIQICS